MLDQESEADGVNAMNVISSQQKLLAAALEKDGWSVVDRATNLAYWAYHEVWTIESQWRPTGLRAFVVFLVDADPPLEVRPRRRPVWAVECMSGSPWESAINRETIAFAGITHWDQGIVQLIEGLAQFRNRLP